MAQVDFVHFFNNSFWIFIQFICIYTYFCVIFVQYFYKILRMRWKVIKYLYLVLNVKFTLLKRTLLNILLVKVYFFEFFEELNYNIFNPNINSILWYYG